MKYFILLLVATGCATPSAPQECQEGRVSQVLGCDFFGECSYVVKSSTGEALIVEKGLAIGEIVRVCK